MNGRFSVELAHPSPFLGIPLTPADLSDAIVRILAKLVAESRLDAAELPDSVVIERPKNRDHGDWATNVAMQLSARFGLKPREFAELLATELLQVAAVSKVDIAGPGFINITVSAEAAGELAKAIVETGDQFGKSTQLAGVKMNLEFVSANPTGPIHIGGTRWAAVGDSLARIFEAQGAEVTREYYFNDFGEQVRRLGESVIALRDGVPVAEDGYKGDYVGELATAIPADVAARATEAREAHSADPDRDEVAVIGKWASERIRLGIEASLAALGVKFDVWRSEGSLYTEGFVDRAIEKLRAAGWLEERDGALWFKSTAFGDDKDRVIKKSTGAYTYFGSDIGYVEEKFGRGFDHLVYVWGADHHGTVARVRNAGEALGYQKEHMEMLLVAWVRFVRDGVEMSMSKRAGTFITLDELLEEIGVDAARWYFASRSATTAIDFDIEAAKAKSSDNPVYYAQYAHARMRSILRKAAAESLTPAETIGSLLDDHTSPEAKLARAIVRLPEVVEDSATHHETQGVTTYATELATAFSAFYRDAKVVDTAAPERSAGRLRLVAAAAASLSASLRLLGISAPEEM